MRLFRLLVPAMLIATAMSIGPSTAAVTTVATGVVNMPQLVGAFGPESVKFVQGNCAKSAESQSGVTHAIVNVQAYKNKTLRITPTTVAAEIPAAAWQVPDLRVGWYTDCSPVSWFVNANYFYVGASKTQPAVITVTNHVALMIVNQNGINQGYKIECITC